MDELQGPDEQPREFSHTQFALVAIIGIMVLYYFSTSVLALALGIRSTDDDRIPQLQAVAQLAFLLVPTLLALKYSPLGPRQLLRLNRSLPGLRTWLCIATCFVAVLSLATAWEVVHRAILPPDINAWLESSYETTENVLAKFIEGRSVFTLIQAGIVMALIPALAEELLFRGLIQRSLEESLGGTRAIINTAIMFALVHLNPHDLISLLALSLVLGTVAHRTASLVPGMILHGLNNLFALFVLVSQEVGEKNTPPELSLPVAVVLLVGSVVVLVIALRVMPTSELATA